MKPQEKGYSLNLHYHLIYPGPVGTTSALTEEQMTTMSPTAAAVSKIKPGMKLTEVYETECQHPLMCHLMGLILCTVVFTAHFSYLSYLNIKCIFSCIQHMWRARSSCSWSDWRTSESTSTWMTLCRRWKQKPPSSNGKGTNMSACRSPWPVFLRNWSRLLRWVTQTSSMCV